VLRFSHVIVELLELRATMAFAEQRHWCD